MLSFLTRFVVLLLAGFALFRLWRANRSSDRWINIVIAVGFLGRAVIGQILFWISYEQLPIARALQMGDGLWFFARDALIYFPTATQLAQGGVHAIIDYSTGGPSVAFVKVLSSVVYLLGPVTSVAVLLNLFCYLGTMAVIVRWSEGEPRARLAAAFAICAISLSPAFFLWSLQPLKDTFFQFIVIAFIGACAAWQRIWTAPRARMSFSLLIAAAMWVTILAISGVRWYFAFALFIAASIFLLVIASLSQGRKTIAFAACVVVIALLSRAFLLGGGPYVPMSIIRVMTPSTAISEVRVLPSQIFGRIEMARDSFDRAGGRTSIHLGGSMSKLDHALGGPADDGQPHSEISSIDSPPIPKEGMEADPPPPVPTPVPASKPATTTSPSVAPPPVTVTTAPKVKITAVVPRAVPHRRSAGQRVVSITTRLLTGVASVALPRSIGERLGLFHIGGGQGMFWFTELDTFVFDCIILFAMFALASRRSVSWRNPLVWFLALLTLLAGLPLAYAITNYGTLFRLREMIYIGLALTPLAVVTKWRRDEIAGAPDGSPAS